MLADRGWNTEQGASAMLKEEMEKTWSLLRELAPDPSVFSVFLIKNDYHNLKAAIKSVLANTGGASLFLPEGTVDTEVVRKAAETGDVSFCLLPCRDRRQKRGRCSFAPGTASLPT